MKKKIVKHEEKIKKEKMRNFQDEGMIRHWEAEIASFRTGIAKNNEDVK
ncbi:MAG TPA: hypothetical protein VFF47_01355 [Nitrospirota bacterium]|nr:hypothetical protein [Nitrospirota bacterium]